MTRTGITFSHTAADDFEPYMTPNGPEGDVHWIRDTGDDGVATRTGIWRADERSMPDAFEVVFAGAETILILEGALEIFVYADESTRVLSAGDIASFEKGAKTRWTRRSPVIKTLMFIAE